MDQAHMRAHFANPFYRATTLMKEWELVKAIASLPNAPQMPPSGPICITTNSNNSNQTQSEAGTKITIIQIYMYFSFCQNTTDVINILNANTIYMFTQNRNTNIYFLFCI